jgi:hypothetical protein
MKKNIEIRLFLWPDKKFKPFQRRSVMKRILKRSMLVLSLLASILLVNSGAFADTISGNHVVVKSGGVETSYNLDEVKMEVENGKTKVCICRMLSFRALQMLASQFSDGVVPKDDIRIFTSWTTDGPEELFVEVMGWNHKDLAFMKDATDRAYLTIEDAVFFFTQKSTGRVWKVNAREGLYPIEFFTFRTLIQTGQATTEQKTVFQTALRPQAVLNMETLPIIDKFNLQAIPFLGADKILRIPVIFVSGGIEYEVTLKKVGNSKLFKVIEVSPLK